MIQKFLFLQLILIYMNVIKSVLSQLKKKHPNYFNDFKTQQAAKYSKPEIPIVKSGLIQDQLFKQDEEIFDMMKNDHDHDVEGFSYQQIKINPQKEAYLQQMKKNIPKYFYLKSGHIRKRHFQNCGTQYLKKLGLQFHQQLIQQNHHNKIVPKIHRERTPYKLRKHKLPKKQEFNKNQYQIADLNHGQTNKSSKKQQKYQNLVKEKLQKNQEMYSTPTKNQIVRQSTNEGQQLVINVSKQQEQPIILGRPKKKVKFQQVQYVKDFNKFKTPKKISRSCQKYLALKQVQNYQRESHLEQNYEKDQNFSGSSQEKQSDNLQEKGDENENIRERNNQKFKQTQY